MQYIADKASKDLLLYTALVSRMTKRSDDKMHFIFHAIRNANTVCLFSDGSQYKCIPEKYTLHISIHQCTSLFCAVYPQRHGQQLTQ